MINDNRKIVGALRQHGTDNIFWVRNLMKMHKNQLHIQLTEWMVYLKEKTIYKNKKPK